MSPVTWEAERQKNLMNPGDGGFSEPRLCHCTPAWVTRAKLRLKKKGMKQGNKSKKNPRQKEKTSLPNTPP